MRKNLLLTCAFVLILFAGLSAQDRTISGKVTSAEDGEALPGVSVQVKGTTQGSVTDVDGIYNVTVPAEGATLVFSFIGLKSQEIAVGSRSVIDVVMDADVTQLSEIIVSGVAAETPREKLTVSVTKVSAELINQVPSMSVAGSLSGKVSGVRISSQNGTPGGGADLMLRGDNNLGVGSSPLIIMDGIILEGGISDINPDDIESIEVVKGASASSLYGSRAGNGVIVISSKRGNRLNVGQAEVTVRNELGFQELERYIDLAEHHAFTLASDWTSAKDYTKFDGVTYPAGYKGGFDPDVAGSRALDTDHYMDNDFGLVIDHQDALFRRGMNYTNYVSVGTRTMNSNIFASFENNKQEGIIENTDGYGRQNFRLNFDTHIFDWLKLSASNLIANTSSQFPANGGGIFFDIVLAEPDNNLFLDNPDGQPYYLRHNQWSNEENPLYYTWKIKRDQKRKRLLTNYNLKADVTDWFNIEGSFSMETIKETYSNYHPKDTWQIGGTDPIGIQYSDGYLYERRRDWNTQRAQITGNFDQQFGDLIARGKLSYLYENVEFDMMSAEGYDFIYGGLPSLRNFPNDRTSVNNEDGDLNEVLNGQKRQEIAQNVFVIGSLDYKDKILFDGMYRYDQSSLFGVNERARGYYRVSGGYRISEDVEIPGIQELKIRSAYGTAGIRPAFYYQYQIFNWAGSKANEWQSGNKNLKPSNTAEFEVALNARFLERFNFEAIYANALTTDQFLRQPLVSAVFGFNNQWVNAGDVEATTIEINLGAKVINTDDIQYDAGITFTKTEQMIKKLDIPAYQSGPDGLWYIKEGEPYGAIYGYDWVRTLDQMTAQLGETETIADYALNSEGYVIEAGTEGTVNEAPIRLKDENGDDAFVQIGDGNPDFYMGIRNNFTWKGVNLYVLLDWKQGGDVYNRKSQWLTRDDRSGILDMSDVPDGEKKAFDYFKGFYDVNSNNAYWVEDASFIKIREAALGYSVPASMLESVTGGALNGATLKLIGRNLLTFTKYSGYDPEVGSIRNPFDGTGTYPNFRNYSVSLTLKF